MTKNWRQATRPANIGCTRRLLANSEQPRVSRGR